MALKSYIWVFRFLTLFFLIALGAIIVYIDPETSGELGKIGFYFIAFLFLVSLFSLFLLFLRRKTLGESAAMASLSMSFRQSILLSILAIGLLLLQSLKMLIWWDGLLLLGGVFLIELYFLSKT